MPNGIKLYFLNFTRQKRQVRIIAFYNQRSYISYLVQPFIQEAVEKIGTRCDLLTS